MPWVFFVYPVTQSLHRSQVRISNITKNSHPYRVDCTTGHAICQFLLCCADGVNCHIVLLPKCVPWTHSKGQWNSLMPLIDLFVSHGCAPVWCIILAGHRISLDRCTVRRSLARFPTDLVPYTSVYWAHDSPKIWWRLSLAVTRLLLSINVPYSTSGSVNTGMANRLRSVKQSRHAASHLGRLSLQPFVGR